MIEEEQISLTDVVKECADEHMIALAMHFDEETFYTPFEFWHTINSQCVVIGRSRHYGNPAMAQLIPLAEGEYGWEFYDECRKLSDLCREIGSQRQSLLDYFFDITSLDKKEIREKVLTNLKSAANIIQKFENRTSATVYGFTAELAVRAVVTDITGEKVCAIYTHKADELINIKDEVALKRFFKNYTFDEEYSIRESDLAILKANNMEDEIHRLYRRVYEQKMQQEKSYYNEARAKLTPFGDGLHPYMQLFFDYLQEKIDQNPVKEDNDFRGIILHDGDKVLALLDHAVHNFYNVPKTEGNRKHISKLGAVLGILMNRGYIEDMRENRRKEMIDRFVTSYPECADLREPNKWNSIEKYYKHTKEAERKQEEMEAYVDRFLK